MSSRSQRGLRGGVDALVMFAGANVPCRDRFQGPRKCRWTAWHLVNVTRRSLDLPLLLIAGETTADARRILSEHGVAFIDGLGNAQLELPGLLLHVAGNWAGRPAARRPRACRVRPAWLPRPYC